MPVFGQDFPNVDAGNYPEMVEDLEEDEKEDYFIKETDLLIVTGKV